MTDYLGLDIGYDSVKIVGKGLAISFPSVIGDPKASKFQTHGESNIITVEYNGRNYNVGEGAIEQSRKPTQSRERDWINSDMYGVLMAASFSAIGGQGTREISLVTGLPYSYFDDRNQLKERFNGEHVVMRKGKDRLVMLVKNTVVVPQGMGALYDVAFDNEGNVQEPEAFKRIGIIDIGGNTTGVLYLEKMGDFPARTDSIETGGWDIVEEIREPLGSKFPGLSLNDYVVREAVLSRTVLYKGRDQDISEIVDAPLATILDDIVNRAGQLWPGRGADLNHIYITGGGAKLFGNELAGMFDHASVRVMEDSVFANARGYYKLALNYQKRKGE